MLPGLSLPCLHLKLFKVPSIQIPLGADSLMPLPFLSVPRGEDQKGIFPALPPLGVHPVRARNGIDHGSFALHFAASCQAHGPESPYSYLDVSDTHKSAWRKNSVYSPTPYGLSSYPMYRLSYPLPYPFSVPCRFFGFPYGPAIIPELAILIRHHVQPHRMQDDPQGGRIVRCPAEGQYCQQAWRV